MFVFGVTLQPSGSFARLMLSSGSGPRRERVGARAVRVMGLFPLVLVANLIWKSQAGGGVPSIAAARTCCCAAAEGLRRTRRWLGRGSVCVSGCGCGCGSGLGGG